MRTILRFYSPDGELIDTVVVYTNGHAPANCAMIPARTAWVEVPPVVSDES